MSLQPDHEILLGTGGAMPSVIGNTGGRLLDPDRSHGAVLRPVRV